jgi:hypothetical protein
MTPPSTTRPVRPTGPTYWFVKLNMAIEEGDWLGATEAVNELRDRGIEVRLDLGRLRDRETESARV